MKSSHFISLVILPLFIHTTSAASIYSSSCNQSLPEWEPILQTQEIVDLTGEYPSFQDNYTDTTVAKRDSINITFLKQLAAQHEKVRISVEDSQTYITINHLKNEGQPKQFTINEWDFKQAQEQYTQKITLPLTMELLQNKADGTGSVSASLELGVASTYKQNGVFTVALSPSLSVGIIPGGSIGFSVTYLRKSTKSITLSTTFSGSVTCNGVDGHSVFSTLKVTTTKYKNIKVKGFTFDENTKKWAQGPEINGDGSYSPVVEVVCLTNTNSL
ncbi:hypothetical protein PSN45_002466 [Yamadazyma tenuis]|uniref:uncharacterized protein n=1 Tax=Candida tenuis TaxID=2315449 RepID=UPI0027A88963|nr:hypothetical protein PSN45_002466 [Yamadazyma tenuis]